jgi:RNA polymerase sigma-70 factor, ECF subfamily
MGTIVRVEEQAQRWDEATTEDLVAAAQGGREEAREALFARYRPRVLAIARSRLGHDLRRALDSQDLVQEALLEAAVGLERFEWRGESSLIRWMARLLEHRAIAQADRIGAQKRDVRREIPLEADDSSSSLVGPEASSESPLRAAERAEDEELMHAALDRLPLHQREVIVLRDYAGCSWEEVAAELSLPSPDAARMLHVRALAKLGKLLSR